MRKEILRMERVTYKEADMTRLEDFNLQIYEGEIMGMLPFNGQGMADLLKLLQVNLPLYDGYIYYNGEQVNSWKESFGTHTRIGVIQAHSSRGVVEPAAPAFFKRDRHGDDGRDKSRASDGISACHCGTASLCGGGQSSDCAGGDRCFDQ